MPRDRKARKLTESKPCLMLASCRASRILKVFFLLKTPAQGAFFSQGAFSAFPRSSGVFLLAVLVQPGSRGFIFVLWKDSGRGFGAREEGGKLWRAAVQMFRVKSGDPRWLDVAAQGCRVVQVLIVPSPQSAVERIWHM